MEMMISDYDLFKVCNKCGFSYGLCLSSNGLSGGLGVWWKDVDVQNLLYDRR